MKKIFLLAFCVASMACNSTLTVRLKTKAEMPLPSHIRKLAFLDYSQIKPTTQTNPPDQVLIENPDSVKPEMLSYASLVGCKDLLINKSDRFLPINIPFQLYRSEEDTTFKPMAWKVVKGICNNYQTDALAVLESFETRFEKVPMSSEMGVYRPYMKGKAKIRWRIYDARDSIILFEDYYSQELEWANTWDESKADTERIPIRDNAVAQLAYQSGATFARIISPTYEEAERKIYDRKTGPTDDIAQKMELAGKYAREKKWDEAIEIWRPIASHAGYGRTAGKAAYNMAVACEIKGDLDVALIWAEKAANLLPVGDSLLYYDYLLGYIEHL